MLKINGRKFAKNNSEFVNTLFQKDGTAIGFYKKLKGRIMLYDMQNNLFACLVHNRHGEKFFVSASLKNGKPYYMFALSTKDEQFLGFNDISFTMQNKIASSLI